MRWRAWLGWANIGQFLRSDDRQFLLTTTSLAGSIDIGSLHLTSGVTAEPAPAKGATWMVLVLDEDDLRLQDPIVQDLLRAAVSIGLTVAPMHGYEPQDPNASGWQVDVAWPDVLVGVVTDEVSVRDGWLAAQGWDVRHAADWTATDLVAAAHRPVRIAAPSLTVTATAAGD